MKATQKKEVLYDTPETIGGGCMTGRKPSQKELKKLADFIADRKIELKSAANKKHPKTILQ